MLIKKELKLNRFKVVAIPENKAYFQRFGERVVPAGMYTGDDEVAPQTMNKTDILALMAERDRQLQMEQSHEGEDS